MKRVCVFDKSSGIKNVNNEVRGNYKKTGAQDDDLPSELISAKGVVIDDSLAIESRPTIYKIMSGNFRDIFHYNGNILAVIDGEISLILLSGKSVDATIGSGIITDTTVSWAYVNEEVYFVSGPKHGRVLGEQFLPWKKSRYGRETERAFSGPPDGERVAFFLGRVWIANDNFIFFSEPLGFGLFDLGNNFIGFPGKILNIAVVGASMFVFTTNGINLVTGSGIKDLSSRIIPSRPTKQCSVFSGKDVFHTEESGLMRQAVFFVDDNGVFVGYEGGEISNVSKNVNIQSGAAASTIIADKRHIFAAFLWK